MFTKTTTGAVAAAFSLALMLPACGDTAESSKASPGSTGAAAADANLDAALAAEPIPSQDVADAAAEAEITDANANDEFEALKKEIDADG